jgi:hypothetical protein
MAEISAQAGGVGAEVTSDQQGLLSGNGVRTFSRITESGLLLVSSQRLKRNSPDLSVQAFLSR